MSHVHVPPGSLTARQGEVLTFVAQHPSCSVGAIAVALGITPAAATKLVLRMERKGFVTRTTNAWDRRSIIVRLTQGGRDSLPRFDAPPPTEHHE